MGYRRDDLDVYLSSTREMVGRISGVAADSRCCGPKTVRKRIASCLIILLAIVFHLAYGGFCGGALWAMARRVTVWKGLAIGVFLWLIMQLAVFPFLGWGVFASKLNSKVAAAALIEHLVFGTVLGLLGAQSTARAQIPGTL